MKTKVILVSTRWIHQKDSIFSNAQRCIPSVSLKEYFCSVSNVELRKTLARKRKNQSVSNNGTTPQQKELVSITKEKAKEIRSVLTKRLKDDANASRLYVKGDYLSYVKMLYDIISTEKKKEEYKDQVNDLNEILEKIRPYIELTTIPPEKEELPPFSFSQEKDDFEECLECNAINIDQEASSGLTIADRLSLYKVMEDTFGDETGDKEYYLVYAVWPLADSDKIMPKYNEYEGTGWVDHLTKAVREEFKEEDVELILFLHDNDMFSTKKTPLKTIEIDSTIQDNELKGIKRTTAVFQHSNMKFLNLARQDNKNARVVYQEARKIIVYDFIFQLLARLSKLLASYTGSNDKDADAEEKKCIRDIIERLENFVKDEHDPEGYLKKLDSLKSACNSTDIISPSCLVENCCYVNGLIKEIYPF